jgi:hypothetical protein
MRVELCKIVHYEGFETGSFSAFLGHEPTPLLIVGATEGFC